MSAGRRVRIAICALNAWEGGRLYAENLGRSVLTMSHADRPDLYWIAQGDATVHPEIEAGATVIRMQATSGRAQGLLEAARLRTLLNVHRVDFVMPLSLRLVGLPARGGWIPDLQQMHMPEMWSEADRRSNAARYQEIARRSDVVVLSSESVASDFRKFAPDSAHKVRVLNFATPLGRLDLTGSEEARRVVSELPRRYAYIPNQFWKHKDHPTALRALASLAKNGLRVPLVCTGKLADFRHPEWADSIRRLIADCGLTEQVKLLGHVSREVQLEVFRAAALVIQPSLFEGWSTVVEDARALRRPLALSRIPTHVEQDPPGARFFTPGDHESLATAVREAWAVESVVDELEELRSTAATRCAEVGRRLTHIAAEAARARPPLLRAAAGIVGHG